MQHVSLSSTYIGKLIVQFLLMTYLMNKMNAFNRNRICIKLVFKKLQTEVRSVMW